MSNGLPVQFQLGQLPIGYCFTGLQQYANDIISILTGFVSGNFQGVIIGPNLPLASQQSNVWIKLNVDLSPIGWFTFWNGQWVTPHPIAPGSQFRLPWKGLEGDLWKADGGDGLDPSTNAPTPTTGAMWQIDPDFAFRVAVGVGNNDMATSPVAYDGNPKTVIHQGDLIGEEKHTLVTTEGIDHRHVTGRFKNNSGADTSASELFDLIANPDPTIPPIGLARRIPGGGGGTPGTKATDDISNQTGDYAITSNPVDQTVTAHNNMPPGIVVGYAMRTVRKYIVGG